MDSPTPDGPEDSERLPLLGPEMTDPCLPPSGPTETVDQPVSAGTATGLHWSEPDTDGSRPTLPAQDGVCFRDYDLIRKIAQGGMGVVFQARQKSPNRLVALKMIAAGRLATAAEVQRFRAEAAGRYTWSLVHLRLSPSRPGRVTGDPDCLHAILSAPPPSPHALTPAFTIRLY